MRGGVTNIKPARPRPEWAPLGEFMSLRKGVPVLWDMTEWQGQQLFALGWSLDEEGRQWSVGTDETPSLSLRSLGIFVHEEAPL
jgi:hypothetical protein